MKRQLAIALGLAVVSTSAFASKARLEALGQSANGSQYVDDHRSIFLNPAHLNHHKDFVTFEFGDTSKQTDARTTPRAEGGAFKASGNMVYGLYLGEESNIANGLRTLTGSDHETNTTTVFAAGDAGVQWGASILFSQTKQETAPEEEGSAMRARLGVISGNIDAFANIGLTNKYETDSALEYEGKSSFDIGVNYGMGDVSYMVRVQSIVAEEATSGDEFKANNTHVGVAKEYKLNDKAVMWASAWYMMDKSECDATFQNAAGPCGTADEKSDTSLPVTIALEATATDWLKLRASVSQNVFVSTTANADDTNTDRDTTATALGASFTYGDLMVDGVVGGTNNANGDTSTTGQFGTDDMLHRVSVTYNF